MGKRVIQVMLLILFFCLFVAGCKSNPQASGVLENHTECKGNAGTAASAGSIVATQECIEYQYDGMNRLILKHINAAFNCCPGDLTARIEVKGNTITITEKEKEAGCHCMCLFDLDYSVENLKTGVYLIRILNQDKPETEPTLETTVDLGANPGGRQCFERSGYPWEGQQ